MPIARGVGYHHHMRPTAEKSTRQKRQESTHALSHRVSFDTDMGIEDMNMIRVHAYVRYPCHDIPIRPI